MGTERYDGILLNLSLFKNISFVNADTGLRCWMAGTSKKGGDCNVINFSRDEIEVLFELKTGILSAAVEMMGGTFTTHENYFAKKWTRTVASKKLANQMGLDTIRKNIDGGYTVYLSETKRMVLKLFQDKVYAHVWDNSPRGLYNPDDDETVCMSLTYSELQNLLNKKEEIGEFLFTDCAQDMGKKYWEVL